MIEKRYHVTRSPLPGKIDENLAWLWRKHERNETTMVPFAKRDADAEAAADQFYMLSRG